MPIQPGSPASQMPPDLGWINQKFAEIERWQREALPSVAASFAPVIADLQAKQAALEALLEQTVQAGQASATQTNFGIALTDADYATANIVVPDGFTTALVMCVVTAGATNTAASTDFMYLAASVAGGQSRQVFVMAAAGASASSTTARSTLLTGLTPGSSIECKARIHTQGNAWGVEAANRAYTEAIATFLR